MITLEYKMKDISKKILTLLLIITLSISTLGVSVFAEDVEEPQEPRPAYSIYDVSYDLSGKNIKMMWNEVTDFGGREVLYAIRCWKTTPEFTEEKQRFVVDGLTTNEYTATSAFSAKLKYYFQVVHYVAGEEPDWNKATRPTRMIFPDFSDLSGAKNVTAKFSNSTMAKNTKKLGEIVQKDNYITVKWTVENPSQYGRFELLRISETDSYLKLTTKTPTSKTSYSYKYLSPKGTYRYIVRCYPKTDNCNSVYLQSAKAEAPKVAEGYLTSSEVQTKIVWTAEITGDTKLYDEPGGKVVKTAKDGDSLECTGDFSPKEFGFWEEPSWVEVKSGSKKLWAKWSQVDVKYHVTKKDYAWSVKDKFINSGKWKSKTSYLIWVNRYTQRTNIFHKENKKWVLKKVYDCNTGNYYQPSDGGQKYIKGHSEKVVKEYKDGRLYYFVNSTKFGGSGTFHTRCRWVDTNGLRNAVKRHPTTKGCVRLYDAAAAYVYGLPIGTGVVIK